jgi:hypothetical protein
MDNAKEELLETLKNHDLSLSDIVAAEINYCKDWNPSNIGVMPLKVGYTPEDLSAFLGMLDFSYYTGYGGQELFGTVWLTDNRWLERGEYDGSEWWELKHYPPFPSYLTQ